MSADHLDPKQSISAFYAGRSVFVTGATGFLGKVLIEKLLRSCPDIHEIFMLMRPKKGTTIDSRLQQLLRLPLFDKLREENPDAFKKLIPVTGDTQVECLGLPPLERKVITEKVSIIFHVAASVRFDDSLQDAVFTNTRSTRDVCILAGSMKKLVALVHVSTTYAHADKPEVEETLYPFDADWKKTIKIAETIDNHTLSILTTKYLGSMPNTYTFTKRLAEQVISDYSKVLPCTICRPSIVVPTLSDPFGGWIDNLNGPVGLMIGGGKGVLRALYANSHARADYIPVDAVIKTIIIASWKRGLTTITKDPTVFVYNCSLNDIYAWPFKQLSQRALLVHEDVPLDNCIWKPRIHNTNSRTIHYILTLLLHVLPAIIIDLVLKISGKRTGLLRLQRQIYSSNTFLFYFMNNEWKFHNEKALMNLQNLPVASKEHFYQDVASLNVLDFLRQSIICAKVNILHEDLNQIDKAKAHYKRMDWIDRIVRYCMVAFLAWIFYRYISANILS